MPAECAPLPLPTGDNPWAGLTKDRLVARSVLDSTPAAERLVRRAVARAKDGDRDGVRFLYMRFADNVYGYVRTIVRDHHDAEDVTQQVFAKLMVALPRYEERSVPFIAWLLRIAHNAAVDAVRTRRTTPTAEVLGHDAAVSEEAPERARSLRAAIATLPHDQREVVVLRHVLGLTPLEIAEQLGRSNSSVYGLHHRGRRALCAELRRLESAPLTARGNVAVAA